MDHHSEQKGPRATFRRIQIVINSFSPRERFFFFVLIWIVIAGILTSLWQLNTRFRVEVPAPGGSLTEGVIGTPRFINPLLAISDTDRDITQLVYSGLLRPSHDGSLQPDLAESFDISENGLVYTFVLKDTLSFHDGKALTADDVVFTVTRAQDPVLKSPRRANWEGVAVEKIDERTVRFTLPQPYAPFLENTTMGILPRHIWQNVDSEQFGFSEFNIHPVGSGPYMIDNIKRNSSGVPERYTLKPFRDFALGTPFIQKLHFVFLSNEDAFLDGILNDDIESIHAISPHSAQALAEQGFRIEHPNLPRTFAVFFNQNEASVLTDLAVRKALSVAIDREHLINEVLDGFGTPLLGPIPPGSIGYEPLQPENRGTSTPSHIEEARAILERNGWKQNDDGVYEKNINNVDVPLSFSISTSDVSELIAVGEYVTNVWKNLGADITLKIFRVADLNKDVIRPRDYDALFFGEIVGRSSDLFAFWHSSQRNDPGLNVALYANISVDKYLEDARTAFDIETRIEKHQSFAEEVAEDIPAVFLYAPRFIYILPHYVRGITLGSIVTPSERFLNIHEWYIETDHVWKIFAD